MTVANQLAKALKKKLGKRRLFYVCRDAERAEAGLLIGIKNFVILTNDSPFAVKLKKKYPGQIVLIKSAEPLDTLELLKRDETGKLIKEKDLVVVFKPTVQIEAVCNEKGWKLINPPAKLANLVEEKLPQIEWLGGLRRYLPDTKITALKNIGWRGKKFILQFNRAHTGSGTMLIASKKQLEALRRKFPEREARVSEYIKGPMITNNNIVWGGNVLSGNLSYQITGLAPFTDNAFATVGNDWALPLKILSARQRNDYQKIAAAVGKRLASDGWRGLFGLDMIADEKTGRFYLIEINARQPASTSYESVLQFRQDKNGLNTFAVHLAALLGLKPVRQPLVKIIDGAQFVQRVTSDIQTLPEPLLNDKANFRYMRYLNKKPGSDLLRLQSPLGVMEKHGKLGGNGISLVEFVNFVRAGRYWGGSRAGAIIVKNGRLLLMRRSREGHKYFAMPGGRVEKSDRNAEQAAKREIMEETGLKIEVDKDKNPVAVNLGRDEIYFWAKNIRGRALLGGPEKLRNHAQNHYSLAWVKLSELKKINLLPPILKNELILCFRQKRKN